MPTINLGRVGFVNKNTYSAIVNYKVNDIVKYQEGIYAALQPNIGQTPASGGNIYWQEWVENIIPAQAGNNGKFLTTDGTNLLWSSNPMHSRRPYQLRPKYLMQDAQDMQVHCLFVPQQH